MFGKKENQKDINSQEVKKELVENIQESENNDKKEEKSKGNDLIKNLEEENKKLKDTLMRTLAELDNTRRRSSEENEKTAKYAISKFAEELIPVMEDFYLAFDNVKDIGFCNEKNAKDFFDGIKLTQNELKKVFEKNGLIRIFPLNEEFNPDFHEAISQVESENDEEGKIIQVMQAGYKIKDRLLRPALVIVSKGKINN